MAAQRGRRSEWAAGFSAAPERRGLGDRLRVLTREQVTIVHPLRPPVGSRPGNSGRQPSVDRRTHEEEL